MRLLLKTYNKKHSAYTAAELAALDDYLNDYFENTRRTESKLSDDLQKHLWLANGAALTVSVGYMQVNRTSIDIFQYLGVIAFIAGLTMLIITKFMFSYMGARDRARFQDAVIAFMSDKEVDSILRIDNIRDVVFERLRTVTRYLVWATGVAFILGCILTVVGIA